MEEVLDYLAENIKQEIQKYFLDKHDIEEIRLRSNKPIILKNSNGNKILIHIVSKEELLETFQKVCEHSIYSYQKQICEGFITIKGGHRVGVTGSCVVEDGEILNINYISSLNFRIAKEKKDVSYKIIPYIIQNNEILNTLIVSKPGCGKTTILRDLVRKISTGIEEIGFKAKTCGIVDERGEIAAMYKGAPQNDIGILSDVIENIYKSTGMRMLIRSMSPEIIVCDEIGSKEDAQAINYAVTSGVKGIFTAHGDSLEDIMLNEELKKLLDKHLIESIIFLDDKKRGEIKSVYILDKENKTYINRFEKNN
ncbi:MAG: stage III sporulation protein AA [Clostridia bacterium]|nr:stage III sporulation protein AA [Clostridia bacterium]